MLSRCVLLQAGVAPHCSTDTQPKVIFAAAGAAGSLARDERQLQQAVNKPSQAAAHLGRLHANFKLLISSWLLFSYSAVQISLQNVAKICNMLEINFVNRVLRGFGWM